MLFQAKLRELDIAKTNDLDYLGFELDGHDLVNFFIYTMMGSKNYIPE
jgi:hypothetical protein